MWSEPLPWMSRTVLVRGMPVKDTGKPIMMPVGEAGLGRVLNVVGRPVDGLGPVSQEKMLPIHRASPQVYRTGYNRACS